MTAKTSCVYGCLQVKEVRADVLHSDGVCDKEGGFNVNRSLIGNGKKIAGISSDLGTNFPSGRIRNSTSSRSSDLSPQDIRICHNSVNIITCT